MAKFIIDRHVQPRALKCLLTLAIYGLPGASFFGCASSGSEMPGGSGGSFAVARTAAGGAVVTGGTRSTGEPRGSGGVTSSGSSSGSGGSNSKYVVAMFQSSKQQATALTTSDIADLVATAVTQAGGLDFIEDGQTIVLKPNLVTFYEDAGEHTASPTVNGVSTDWRVVKAVADLVRAKNPSGKILVMEGSRILTIAVYPVLGYTPENFGASVDEFLGIEGTSCSDSSTANLKALSAPNGKQYWLNSRYLEADVVIGIPTLATDAAAGIGGAVASLGIGATPAGQYSSGTNSIDCTRTKIDQSSPEVLGEFILNCYSLRPADFVVMDGLQGLQHGPLPVWDDSGTYDYQSSIMNMRLILAGRNAVAVDSIAASVMKCEPDRVPYLSSLKSDGLGTTDMSEITLVGKRVSEVAKPFAGKQTDICPGK